MSTKQTNESAETTGVELINPKELVIHPLRKEVLLSMEEKPGKVKAAIDNAWTQTPKQIVPVTYTVCEIDGVLKKALLDGEVRVYNAIMQNVPVIPAIRVTTDGLDTVELFKKILVPNQSFHISLLEIGKAATRLFQEMAPGQGTRNTEEKGINVDDIIAGILGYGLKSSRVKKCRLVYEVNPELLRQVDNKELKSLAAAYNTVKRPKTKKVKNYGDGDEIEITGNMDEREISVSQPTSNTPVETDTQNTKGSASVWEEMPMNNNISTFHLLKEKDGNAGSTTDSIPEVTVKLEGNEKSFPVTCPCCTNKIRVTTI